MTNLGTFTGQHNVQLPPDPCPTLPQAILAGLSLALFVVGGVLLMVGLSL
jgi:hypothetical protein